MLIEVTLYKGFIMSFEGLLNKTNIASTNANINNEDKFLSPFRGMFLHRKVTVIKDGETYNIECRKIDTVARRWASVSIAPSALFLGGFTIPAAIVAIPLQIVSFAILGVVSLILSIPMVIDLGFKKKSISNDPEAKAHKKIIEKALEYDSFIGANPDVEINRADSIEDINDAIKDLEKLIGKTNTKIEDTKTLIKQSSGADKKARKKTLGTLRKELTEKKSEQATLQKQLKIRALEIELSKAVADFDKLITDQNIGKGKTNIKVNVNLISEGNIFKADFDCPSKGITKQVDEYKKTYHLLRQEQANILIVSDDEIKEDLLSKIVDLKDKLKDIRTDLEKGLRKNQVNEGIIKIFHKKAEEKMRDPGTLQGEVNEYRKDRSKRETKLRDLEKIISYYEEALKEIACYKGSEIA